MKRVILTACLFTALSGIVRVEATTLQEWATPPSSAPFQFGVPVNIRDLHPDILGVEVKCVVTTAQGAKVASGSTQVEITNGTLRGINQTVLVSAEYLDEQSQFLSLNALSYECGMALLHHIQVYSNSSTLPPSYTPMPPFPPGGGWVPDANGIPSATTTPAQGMSDPRFEAAANTPFVPVVHGVISSNAP